MLLLDNSLPENISTILDKIILIEDTLFNLSTNCSIDYNYLFQNIPNEKKSPYLEVVLSNEPYKLELLAEKIPLTSSEIKSLEEFYKIKYPKVKILSKNIKFFSEILEYSSKFKNFNFNSKSLNSIFKIPNTFDGAILTHFLFQKKIKFDKESLKVFQSFLSQNLELQEKFSNYFNLPIIKNKTISFETQGLIKAIKIHPTYENVLIHTSKLKPISPTEISKKNISFAPEEGLSYFQNNNSIIAVPENFFVIPFQSSDKDLSLKFEKFDPFSGIGNLDFQDISKINQAIFLNMKDFSVGSLLKYKNSLLFVYDKPYIEQYSKNPFLPVVSINYDRQENKGITQIERFQLESNFIKDCSQASDLEKSIFINQLNSSLSNIYINNLKSKTRFLP